MNTRKFEQGSFVFLKARTITSLLQGIREGQFSLLTIQVYLSDLLHSTLPKGHTLPYYYFLPKRLLYREKKIKDERTKLTAKGLIVERELSKNEDKAIRVSKISIEYITRKATRGTCCFLLCYFFRRRVNYVQKSARISYEQIRFYSGINSQAVSASLKILINKKLIKVEKQYKTIRSELHKDSNLYLDGEDLWAEPSFTRDLIVARGIYVKNQRKPSVTNQSDICHESKHDMSQSKEQILESIKNKIGFDIYKVAPRGELEDLISMDARVKMYSEERWQAWFAEATNSEEWKRPSEELRTTFHKCFLQARKQDLRGRAFRALFFSRLIERK